MRLPEQSKNGFGRRSLIALLIGAALVAGGVYWYFSADKGAPAVDGKSSASQAGKRRGPGGPGGANRVQTVRASEARIGNLDVSLSALGTVTASNTAVVKARVDGPLVKINFREGQLVKAGDVLAEIDPRPFQILVDQAHGQLLKDEAQLSAAQVDLERYRGLLAKDSIARQQVDSQDALVRQYRGAVQTDKAQEASARLNLDFTRIKAPAAGRLGLRQVDVGNIVHASDSAGIVVITQTQPINVVFAIPSESLGNVLSRVQNGEKLKVEAWNRDGKALLAQGRLVSIDNQVDVTTGTVKLKAEFANKDDVLFPNQFVNARLGVESRRDVVLLPGAAVQRSSRGTYVYVIDKNEQTVTQRPVKLGPASGELTVIEDGLSAGEQVVLDGADKLRPGAKVDVTAVDGQAQPDGTQPASAANGDTPPRKRRSEGQAEGAAAAGPQGGAAQRAVGGAPSAATAAPTEAGKEGGAGPSPEERKKRWAEINARIDRGEFGEEMKSLPEEERRQRMREWRQQHGGFSGQRGDQGAQ